MTVIARPEVLDKDLYALPWAWLWWVCLSSSQFAGSLPLLQDSQPLLTGCRIQPALPHLPRLSQLRPVPGSLDSVWPETVLKPWPFHSFSGAASSVVCAVTAFSA